MTVMPFIREAITAMPFIREAMKTLAEASQNVVSATLQKKTDEVTPMLLLPGLLIRVN